MGVFSSPHIKTYHERISINGKLISEECVQRIYKENEDLFKDLLFFNLMMFTAFLYFEQEKVDYAIIEVGVGGLFDSTNIVNPIISVVTNISIDHKEYLGNTLESIAENKAGIIKQNTPVVLGYHARHKACFDRAKKKHAQVIEITTSYDDYFIENRVLANKVLETLNIESSNSHCSLPARFEEHGSFIFDMAHNVSGINALKKKVLQKHPGKSIIAIWNMARDKQIAEYVEVLEMFTEKIYFFPHANQRLLSSKEAKKMAIEEYKGQQSDIYLVCGSSYFLQQAKKSLLKKESKELVTML